MQPNSLFQQCSGQISRRSIAATECAREFLGNAGLNVIAVDLSGRIPTLQVESCSLTADLIQQDIACYYKWEKRDGQHHRFGQFQTAGCRVIWVERGH